MRAVDLAQKAVDLLDEAHKFTGNPHVAAQITSLADSYIALTRIVVENEMEFAEPSRR